MTPRDDKPLTPAQARQKLQNGLSDYLAGNGPEAIAALKQRQYSLLFLDIMMPRIDGWGVLDYLRTNARANAPTLFIITAFLDQTVSAADREIVNGMIYKPVDADEIGALMRECVRGGNPSGVLHRTRHRFIRIA